MLDIVEYIFLGVSVLNLGGLGYLSWKIQKKPLKIITSPDQDAIAEWSESIKQYPVGSPKYTAYKNRLASFGIIVNGD